MPCCDARDIVRVIVHENWKRKLVHPIAKAFGIENPLPQYFRWFQ